MLPEVPRNFRNMKDVTTYLFSPLSSFPLQGRSSDTPQGPISETLTLNILHIVAQASKEILIHVSLFFFYQYNLLITGAKFQFASIILTPNSVYGHLFYHIVSKLLKQQSGHVVGQSRVYVRGKNSQKTKKSRPYTCH